MNIQSTSLGLLGVSIGMGAMFSLAPVDPVYAGSFRREILRADGNKMGRMEFTWEDKKVGEDNRLIGFESLTSFSLKSYSGMSYDFDFVNSLRNRKFIFNVTDGTLHTYAYRRTRKTETKQYGFEIKSQDFDSDLIAANIPISVFLTDEELLDEALKTKRYDVNFNLGVSSDSIGPAGSNPFKSDGARFVPAENTAQSVPENSLTTALLIIAGLVFLRPHRIF
ncbi:MAG: hypothetical protein AB4063_15935 [Crocosphaera sp.]